MTEDQELLAKIQAELKEEGVEATEEEIRAAVETAPMDELSEGALEEVAGGISASNALKGLIGATGVLSKYWKCPKCGALLPKHSFQSYHHLSTCGNKWGIVAGLAASALKGKK